MTGRERILAVLERRSPDRIPFEIGGTDCSGVHVIPYKGLKSHFGLDDSPVACGCLTQLIAEFDEEIREALEVDAETLSFGSKETKIWKAPFGVNLIVPAEFRVEDLEDGSSIARNPQGTVYSKRAADACYFDPFGVPLAGITSADELSDFDALFERWDYSYVYDEPIDELAARAKAQYESTDRAVVALWRMHYIQTGQIMRGYEQFLIDLMIDQDLAHALMQKLHQVYLKRTDAFLI